MYDKAQCVGYDQITLSATAGTLLPYMVAATGNLQYANSALIRIESGGARFLMTGVTGVPTTSVGFPILATDTVPLWINGLGNLQNFKVIATGGSPILDVLYFKTAMN